MRFKDKVVVITGAASGMGEAAAELFSEEGAILALNDINGEPLGKVADRLARAGSRVLAFPGTVGNRAFIDATVSTVVKEFGRIDVLLNVAGYASH